MKRFASIVIVIHFLYLPVFSQEKDETNAPPTEWTVDQLVQRSLEEYDGIQARQKQAEAAREGVDASGALPKTEVSASAGTLSSDATSGHEYAITLSQHLSYPGKRARMIELARLEYLQSRLDHDEVKRYVSAQVRLLAWQYAIQQIKTSHIEKRLQTFRLIEGYMRGHRVPSPRLIVERSILSKRVKLMEREIERVQNDTEIIYAKLNLYTRIPGEERPQVSVTFVTETQEIDTDRLMNLAMENALMLRKKRADVETAKIRSEIIRKSLYPDPSFELYYGNEKFGSETQRNLGAGVTVPLPLLSRHGAKRRQQDLLLESAQLDERKAQTEVQQELLALFAQYRMEAANLTRFPIAGIEKMKQELRYAEAEFRKGRIDLPTFLEMDAETHQSIKASYDSQIEYLRVVTEIEYIVGTGGLK